MGHSTEIFSSPPQDRDICAICHDVLQNAVSMKECGHIFCEACVDALQTGTCPNCRAAMTGTNPCFHARESIEAMDVVCPHGKIDGGEDPSSRCMRGDGGEVAQEERCNWNGLLKDLMNHEENCAFKVISCPVDGCSHQCPRKDIDIHLSGSGLFYHIDLMKQLHDTQIQEINVKMSEEMNRKDKEKEEIEQKMEQLEEGIKQKMKALDQKRQHKTSVLKKLKKKIDLKDKKIGEMQKKIDELRGIRQPFEVIDLVPPQSDTSTISAYDKLLFGNFEFFYPSPEKDNHLGLRCIHCKTHPDCYEETKFPAGMASVAAAIGAYGAHHFSKL